MITAHNLNNNNNNVVDVHGSLFPPLALHDNNNNNNNNDDDMLECQGGGGDGDDEKGELQLTTAAKKRISLDATATTTTTTTTTTTQGGDWNSDDDDVDSDDVIDDVISIAPFDPDSSDQLLPGTWYHHHHHQSHHAHANDPNLYLPHRWSSGEAEDLCPTKLGGRNDGRDGDDENDADSIFHMLIDCGSSNNNNSHASKNDHLGSHPSNDTAAADHHHHADLLPSLLMTGDDDDDVDDIAAAGVPNSSWTILPGTVTNNHSALAPADLHEEEEDHDLCSILQQVENNIFDGIIIMEQDEEEVVAHESCLDNDVVMAGITQDEHKLDWQDPPESAPSPLLLSSSSFLSEDSLQQNHQQQYERLAASMRRSQKSRLYITKNYGALLQGHLQQRAQWSKVLKDIETSSAQIQKHFLLADQPPHPVLEPEQQHLSDDDDDPNLDHAHFAIVTDDSPVHSSINDESDPFRNEL